MSPIPIQIYDIRGSWAEFCGGDVSMREFIKENLIYPKEASKKGEQGTVYVEFTVKIDGSLTDVKIKKGVSEYLNNEAIRLIKSMPNWIAAEKSGKLYESSFVLPILFKIKVK
jgi:TonB family protein